VSERRWRLVELAQLAGITEQQVRNYLAAGLLPPAERAANNYRVLTDHHADALRTVRTLAAGHGWPRTRTILTAVHHGNIPAALAAVDDSHAELARERATIAATTHAFTQAADGPAPAIRRQARIGQVATDIGVRTPVLRLWERRGLLQPQRDPTTGYRVYSPAEQRAAHLIAVLRGGGFTFPIIDAAIATMRSNGSLEHALAHLSRRDEQVHHLSLRRLQASAALLTWRSTTHRNERSQAADPGGNVGRTLPSGTASSGLTLSDLRTFQLSDSVLASGVQLHQVRLPHTMIGEETNWRAAADADTGTGNGGGRAL
jgi:DNA-binding transcriptional MerR regulator